MIVFQLVNFAAMNASAVNVQIPTPINNMVINLWKVSCKKILWNLISKFFIQKRNINLSWKVNKNKFLKRDVIVECLNA